MFTLYIHSLSKVLLCQPATILYAMVCISLTRWDQLTQLSGIGCRVWARTYFNGVG